MAHTEVELHFADQHHRIHSVRALAIDGHEWNLSIEVDGHRFNTTCGKWQSVERTLAWLSRHGHQSAAVNSLPSVSHQHQTITSLIAAARKPDDGIAVAACGCGTVLQRTGS